jgi:spore coat polysaccharide biosynthesis protein SpsF
MITAIIQARMGSTRLPKKVLLPLGDTTVLGWVVRRVKESRKISEVVVATSDASEDDAIVHLCEELGVKVFRGDPTDVLDRYYQIAKQLGVKNICRVTGDCPLIDPDVIDRVATEFEKVGCDYISTGRVTSTFPDGMDTEIFSFTALETAWKEAKLPSEREHVTPYIWNHPEKFKISEIKNDKDLSSVRLTIDEKSDYEVLQRIVTNVHPLSMDVIVQYLAKNPDIAAINGSIMRDEGYAKSLEADRRNMQ